MKRKKRKDFQHKGRFWVYIVECSDGTYYTGCTNDIETRIKEHNRSNRGAKYLKGKLPVKLAYVKEYSHYKRAAGRERSIKRLSHKQKEELIRIYGQMTAKDKHRSRLSPLDLLTSFANQNRGDDSQRCEL